MPQYPPPKRGRGTVFRRGSIADHFRNQRRANARARARQRAENAVAEMEHYIRHYEEYGGDQTLYNRAARRFAESVETYNANN